MPATTSLDVADIRATLARRRIPGKRLAQAAGLSQHYTYRVLSGRPCGELACRKVLDGLAALGLDRLGAND